MNRDSSNPLAPYRRAVRVHGAGFKSTLWASEATQQRRFAVFTEMIDLSGCAVLDAGCGRGDLAAFLEARGIGYRSYVGLEAMEPPVAFARERGLARASFVVGDFAARPELLSTGAPEVICFSGSLNTFEQPEAERVLEAAWSAASRALVFNFLSDRTSSGAPADLGPARRFDTLGLLRWATGRTARVALRQDYFEHGHDATILMRREAG